MQTKSYHDNHHPHAQHNCITLLLHYHYQLHYIISESDSDSTSPTAES